MIACHDSDENVNEEDGSASVREDAGENKEERGLRQKCGWTVKNCSGVENLGKVNVSWGWYGEESMEEGEGKWYFLESDQI